MENMLKGTMLEALDMKPVELTPNRVIITMPVGPKTRQPYGILHGGASVALAESAASIGTALNIDNNLYNAAGIEINANHIKSKRDGVVTAIATPLHKGKATFVWDIKIIDEEKNLVCISRCTVAVLKKKNLDPNKLN